jgi:SPP1 gp7 family putative phage head morphogenesis protein
MPQIDPFKLPFSEAIAFFKQKVPINTNAWDDFADEAQDYAFTLSKVTSAELLSDVYGMVLSALENGDSFGQFKKGFNAAIDKAGWNPAKRSWRSQLIFMQNLRQAYGAGRYKQQTDPEMLKLRPYFQYRHGDSRVPRPHHLALDGKIYPANDPFWQTCYPPNGFGCSCKCFSLSKRDIQQEELTVEDSPRETVGIKDKVTGEVKRVPAIIGQPIAEPGFTVAPGASQREAREAILEQAIQKLPPQLQQQVRETKKRGS